MMEEHMHNFINNLIVRTQENKLTWHPLNVHANLSNLTEELSYTYSSIDLFTNAVKMIGSYYLSHQNGEILLLEIFHPSTDVDGILNVYIRPDRNLSLSEIQLGDISSPQNQALLETLRLAIEQSIDSKYPYPDVIYNFCDSIITSN